MPKRRLLVGTAVFCLAVWPALAAGRLFQKRIHASDRIPHALNRLTFGPRPGDIAQVKALGVAKWIDLQLHPDRIPENPVLAAKLKPLETLGMSSEQLLKEYPQTPPGLQMMNTLIPPAQMQRVFNGTLEDRKAFLATLDPN